MRRSFVAMHFAVTRIVRAAGVWMQPHRLTVSAGSELGHSLDGPVSLSTNVSSTVEGMAVNGTKYFVSGVELADDILVWARVTWRRLLLHGSEAADTKWRSSGSWDWARAFGVGLAHCAPSGRLRATAVVDREEGREPPAYVCHWLFSRVPRRRNSRTLGLVVSALDTGARMGQAGLGGRVHRISGVAPESCSRVPVGEQADRLRIGAPREPHLRVISHGPLRILPRCGGQLTDEGPRIGIAIGGGNAFRKSSPFRKSFCGIARWGSSCRRR